MTRSEVHLDEIFLSLQGEAAEVGVPHLFLRLAGCPLRCDYCDTPRSWTRTPRFERHEAGCTVAGENPVGAELLEQELAAVAASHGLGPADLTLAVTGGEPLEQADFLEEWLPQWPGRVLLETSGIWPARLERLLPHVDVISLDWKVDGSVRAGQELMEPGPCARLFGESGAEGWVKLIVSADTQGEQVDRALKSLAREAPGVLTYLQPATRFGSCPGPPPAARLLEWALRARSLPIEVRVLPQVHPLLGAR